VIEILSKIEIDRRDLPLSSGLSKGGSNTSADGRSNFMQHGFTLLRNLRPGMDKINITNRCQMDKFQGLVAEREISFSREKNRRAREQEKDTIFSQDA